MIPARSLETQASSPEGDGPATQATRLASRASSHLVFADGPELRAVSLSSSNPNSTDQCDELLWTADRAIQTVASSTEGWVGAVDGGGQIWLERGGALPAAVCNSPKEAGWCGLVLADGWLATARTWGGDTLVVDVETCTVTHHLAHSLPPVALCASEMTTHGLVVCEWNTVTVWDWRAHLPLVATLSASQLGGGGSGPIWAVSTSPNTVCVGGEDRVVSLLDNRKYRCAELWRTPLKHDVVGLAFKINGRVHALGLDHDLCEKGGEATQRLAGNHRLFRARARWSGVCCDAEGRLWVRDARGAVFCF